jgi:uncharacterized protein (DUF302 family)
MTDTFASPGATSCTISVEHTSRFRQGGRSQRWVAG